MKEIASQVWFLDPYELLDISKLYDFYPKDSMTYNEKLNSFMRFTVYFSIVTYLLNKSSKVFYSIFFGGVLTFILHHFKKDIFHDENHEDFEDNSKEECTAPDENNPFMNVLVSDYHSNPERGEACDVDEDKVKDKMEKHFYKNLYRGVDEVFDNNYSYRQFYTTPNTTIPNDQEGFAKWLYFNEEKTLKESHM
jgi:hypothetical protein